MKKLLLAIAFAPLSLFAQKLEVNIMGGGVYSQTPDKNWDVNSAVSGIGSLQVLANVKSFSIGIKADILSLKAGFEYLTYNTKSLATETLVINSHAFSPCVPVSLVINKKFSLPKSYLHIGLSGGLVFGSSKVTYKKEDEYTVTPPNFDPTGSAAGYSFGAQVGYCINLTKNIGLIGEITPRYIGVTKAFGEKENASNFNTILVPLTIGLSFKF